MRVFHGTVEIRAKKIEKENIIKGTTDETVVHNTNNNITDTTRGYVYLATDEEACKFFAASSLNRMQYDGETSSNIICIYELEIDDNRLECDYDQCKIVKDMNCNNCLNEDADCNIKDCIKYIRAVRVKGDIDLIENLIAKKTYTKHECTDIKYYYKKQSIK